MEQPSQRTKLPSERPQVPKDSKPDGIQWIQSPQHVDRSYRRSKSEKPISVNFLTVEQRSPIAHLKILRNPTANSQCSDEYLSPLLHNSSEAWVRYLTKKSAWYDATYQPEAETKDENEDEPEDEVDEKHVAWCFYVWENAKAFTMHRARTTRQAKVRAIEDARLTLINQILAKTKAMGIDGKIGPHKWDMKTKILGPNKNSWNGIKEQIQKEDDFEKYMETEGLSYNETSDEARRKYLGCYAAPPKVALKPTEIAMEKCESEAVVRGDSAWEIDARDLEEAAAAQIRLDLAASSGPSPPTSSLSIMTDPTWTAFTDALQITSPDPLLTNNSAVHRKSAKRNRSHLEEEEGERPAKRGRSSTMQLSDSMMSAPESSDGPEMKLLDHPSSGMKRSIEAANIDPDIIPPKGRKRIKATVEEEAEGEEKWNPKGKLRRRYILSNLRVARRIAMARPIRIMHFRYDPLVGRKGPSPFVPDSWKSKRKGLQY